MLEDLSVQEILNNIKDRTVSIKEVAEYYLDRIDKYNPQLNAIVLQKDRELIIKEAISKDNLKEKNKPLNGLPIAIKDLTDVVGLKTTYGFPGSKNNTPLKNTLFVNRLIKSGALIIGKTNTEELGVGGHTINRLFGPTSNVYDFSKSAAGSSGGASTAVAAGLLPFADGTDQMGSCRGPAAFANIYGFRPTPGLISVERGNPKKKSPILTTPGCFAKTPEDMAILLDVIIGSDALDKQSFDLTDFFNSKNINRDIFSSYKLGWLSDMNGNYKYEDGILDLCENALVNLETLNLKAEFLKPDLDHEALWKSWVTFRSKGIYEDIVSMNIENIDTMTFQAIWEYNLGKNISDDDLNIALEQKNKCTQQINNIFNNYDFLALPSAQVFPFDKYKQFPETINHINIDTYHRWLEIFILSSLLELPTMTIPIGFNKKGFPMGMQIIAKRKDDLKLFAFAKKYEQVFNYSKNKPLLN